MCFNQLIGLFLLLICLVTNIRMDLVHEILYRIAKTVEYGLNITSAHFLANIDDPRFAKSRSRWNSFAQAVGSEYCHTAVARPRRNWTSCAQRSPAAAPGPPLEFTGVRPAHATDGLVK